MIQRIEELLLRLLRHWLPYYVIAWVVAAVASAAALHYGWHSFDNSELGSQRNDGNAGHATIDFGGQYLMGRMLVTGNGRELYNRVVQREVLTPVYPDADQEPPKEGEAQKSDVNNLMYWTMGDINDAPARRTVAACLAPLAAADPWQAAASAASAEEVWAWHKVTERTFAGLRAEGVREPVLTKLSALDGKEFTCREDFHGEFTKLLGQDTLDDLDGGESGRFEDLVWRLTEREADKGLRNAAHPVGGPLYPPVNAFYYAPLALMEPHTAYRVQQVFNLALVFVAAAGARYLARGRVWWPVLVPCIMLFPGFAGSINLGQNATLTLTILVWGWALAARGRPVLGGMVWGLLAFKPVWALAFLLVPLLSRRWRMTLAMVGTGAALGLLTLPFVGLHSWFDWLSIGKEAAELYDVEKNWIWLSRDLMSVPRRLLLDFGDKSSNATRLDGFLWPDTRWRLPLWLPCLLIGWGLVLFALENTVRLAVLRRRQAPAPDGPPAAFLILGAWMCCFHFMYYDALLGSLGLFLLFTEPRRFLRPLLVALARLPDGVAGRAVVAYHRAALPEGLPPPVPLDVGPRGVLALNRMAPTAFALMLAINYLFPKLGWGSHWGQPWDTFCLMVVWAWCGWQWLRHGEKVATSWDEGHPHQDTDMGVTLAVEAEKNGEATPSPAHPLTPPLPAPE